MKKPVYRGVGEGSSLSRLYLGHILGIITLDPNRVINRCSTSILRVFTGGFETSQKPFINESRVRGVYQLVNILDIFTIINHNKKQRMRSGNDRAD